ncbi:glycosyltransferase [Candidatus Saccharibacteria bacterium]|nr:glycosyltransferase [Candidatus Saccharibacteria bacterium]
MVSVIIPTFKRHSMLFFEIEQLKKQENVSIEIIVINDEIENDPTDSITLLYPDVIYIKSKKKIGPGEKHQLGFSIAHGDFVSFPDDDDYLIDNLFFSKALSIMGENPNIAFVSGNSFIKYESETNKNEQFVKFALNVKGLYSGLDFLENMQGKYTKPLSSVPTVFRKSALERQGFISQIEMSDSSIYMLASMGGDAFFIDDYVSVYRIHNNSLTTKKSSSKWINNVLRQKEHILEKVEKELKNPGQWWLRHIKLTYSFYANTSKSRIEKAKLLMWCFKHNHGFFCTVPYLLKRFVLLLWNR